MQLVAVSAASCFLAIASAAVPRALASAEPRCATKNTLRASSHRSALISLLFS
jgi:hypothetical protein